MALRSAMMMEGEGIGKHGLKTGLREHLYESDQMLQNPVCDRLSSNRPKLLIGSWYNGGPGQ